jgi:hypothetical protein
MTSIFIGAIIGVLSWRLLEYLVEDLRRKPEEDDE